MYQCLNLLRIALLETKSEPHSLQPKCDDLLCRDPILVYRLGMKGCTCILHRMPGISSKPGEPCCIDFCEKACITRSSELWLLILGGRLLGRFVHTECCRVQKIEVKRRWFGSDLKFKRAYELLGIYSHLILPMSIGDRNAGRRPERSPWRERSSH